MNRTKGYFLALLGLSILIGSLVLSTPFAERGEGKGVRETRPAPRPALKVEMPEGLEPDLFPDLPQHEPVMALHETGPIVFRNDELDTWLSFPVPVGKRMLIQTVSARASLAAGQRPAVMFTTTSCGRSATHVIPMQAQGSFPKQGDVFAGVQSVRLYADGGTVIHFKVDRTAVGESDTGFISLSGYLETR